MNKNEFRTVNNSLTNHRLVHELPSVITDRGWQYHHIGIPYNLPKLGEKYHQHLNMTAYGFETSPYGIEWFNLEQECSIDVPDIVRNIPHVAFEVHNLDQELENKTILIAPHRLLNGVRIAMFLHNGAPIELMEFDNKNQVGLIQHNDTGETNCLNRTRLKHEPPVSISEYGWQYHHIGIPYTHPKQGEKYYEHLKIAVLGFETSPYGVEWVRFENGCNAPDILNNIPHLAFMVDNLNHALNGKELLLEPGSPSGGVKVAFIIHDGAPIELMEFDVKK